MCLLGMWIATGRGGYADETDSAVLGSYFLGEKLGVLGKIGCAICLTGSVIIVLHAPPEEEIDSIELLLHYAIQPGKHGQVTKLEWHS